MESRKRTLAKTISWRIIATVITSILASIITKDVSIGVTVGIADTLVKLVCYYMHERMWTRVESGYHVPKP